MIRSKEPLKVNDYKVNIESEMRHLIRFVQRVGFSSRSTDFQSQEYDGFLEEEIKKLLKVISDWQADLVLLNIYNLKELIENKDYVALIRETLKMIPEVKIIAININNDKKNKESKKISNSWQAVVNMPNLMILQEFETIFLDDLGLIVHGGSVFSERGFNYLPQLARLDNRWPNLLVLPESYLWNLTDKGKIRLNAFDYTTLHPWLSPKGERSGVHLAKTETEESSGKSFYIKGRIEKDCVSWETRPF